MVVGHFLASCFVTTFSFLAKLIQLSYQVPLGLVCVNARMTAGIFVNIAAIVPDKGILRPILGTALVLGMPVAMKGMAGQWLKVRGEMAEIIADQPGLYAKTTGVATY